MSSGGQRGIDVSGITGLRLQTASDVTKRIRLQEIYQNFASTTGANAWRNRTPNGYGYFLDFTQGRKEDCSSCVGLPYQYRTVLTFRNA
jgi:hypothetical protein